MLLSIARPILNENPSDETVRVWDYSLYMTRDQAKHVWSYLQNRAQKEDSSTQDGWQAIQMILNGSVAKSLDEESKRGCG